MPTGRIWYLVMNSSHLRILRGLPGPEAPAVAELGMQSGRHRLRGFLHGRAQRGPDEAATGFRPNGSPAFDPLREDAVQFLHEVSEFLGAQQRGDGFDTLVLVAPPEVIELWHAEVAAPVQDAVCCEVARNLVRLPPQELGQAIRGQLEAQGIGFQAGQPTGCR